MNTDNIENLTTVQHHDGHLKFGVAKAEKIGQTSNGNLNNNILLNEINHLKITDNYNLYQLLQSN